MGRLEKEKKELHGRISELDDELKAVETTHQQRDSEIHKLNQEIKVLNSHLSLKERKLQDLEAKVLKSGQDLDIKLANTTKELQLSQSQVKGLQEENREFQKQMNTLSSTSTDFEQLVRKKESELSMLRIDMKKYEADKKSLESERDSLSARHGDMQRRIHELQAQIDAMKSENANLEREAADAKKLLEARISEDAQSGQTRKMLEQQVKDLKTQLYQVQSELSRERQSRDDVQMLGEHKYAQLKQEYDTLNESKITIEKEMYIQQDALRRAKEARAAAEEARKELQSEIVKLRERITRAESARLDAETAAEKKLMEQANDRVASLRKELDAKVRKLEETEAERARLASQVQNLSQIISEREDFKVRNDQHKERLERELVTVKGRLVASENDNRALLNKIQQKNLDIARSNSRASDAQRTRLAQVQAEKSRLEEANKQLSRQVGDCQLTITSLEKQKEKLALSLEDLNHEVAREHKASRNAEKAASTANIQLAEAHRNLETERQLKTQAQANTRKLQDSLDQAHKEIQDCHQQLILLHKVFNPEVTEVPASWEAVKPDLSKQVEIAAILESVQENLRSSEQFKRYSNPSTPNRRFMEVAGDSGRSDRTVDTVSFQKRMDLAAEVEMLQNQLQMSEMQNRHLQSQLERVNPARDMWQDESPSPNLTKNFMSFLTRRSNQENRCYRFISPP
ncbi:myosin-9 [Coccidioides immitis H538.4]|uniref:Myosin-9 n=1 Tax=Coccidioides immitis H538.4 TaxID=396776 RepID=A0A0J8RPZ0_COCIT|nr:myosin-9 [Coccidioides immitis H538.4]